MYEWVDVNLTPNRRTIGSPNASKYPTLGGSTYGSNLYRAKSKKDIMKELASISQGPELDYWEARK